MEPRAGRLFLVRQLASRSASIIARMGTMRTARKLRTNTDFLILGGGIAGVSALAEAQRLGISAICLEAHTRPGGRIRTVRKKWVANYPVELGAEFVHGASMKQL